MKHDLLSHGAVTNNSYGLLDSQTIPSSVRCHSSSESKINIIISKIRHG